MSAYQQEQLDQLAWLVENSDGVVGLNLDGSMMPWAQVFKLYAPALAALAEAQKEQG